MSVCVVVHPVLSSRVTFAGNSTWGQPSRVRQTEGGLGEKRSRREVKGSNPIFYLRKTLLRLSHSLRSFNTWDKVRLPSLTLCKRVDLLASLDSFVVGLGVWEALLPVSKPNLPTPGLIRSRKGRGGREQRIAFYKSKRHISVYNSIPNPQKVTRRELNDSKALIHGSRPIIH